MERRWTIGGACLAVTGTAVSSLEAIAPANDRPALLVSADGRAAIDPAARRVSIEGMRLPLSAYRGVSVDVVLDESFRPTLFRILLAHADQSLDCVLHAACEDTDIVALWRGFSRDLALPMLMRMEDGDTACRAQLGALLVGPAAPRRAPRAFLKRRPQMLRRRQLGLRPTRRAKG